MTMPRRGSTARSTAPLLGALLIGLAACAPNEAPPEEAEAPAPAASSMTAEEGVVTEYSAAFNAHDVAAMQALMADDITWLSLAGDSVMVDATGAEELVAGMDAYFGDFPDVQSEVEIVAVVGAYVHAKETASWSRDGVRSSQSSLSTYEIRDGRVQRVWYFPSS